MAKLFFAFLFLALPTVQAASIFNFSNDPLGTSTPFTDTNNGISAAFSSHGDPGGFDIVASFFSSLTGNVLLDPAQAGLDQLSLNVAFNHELSSVSLQFAVNPLPNTSNTFTLAAYQGSTLVGSATEQGVADSLGYLEGAAAFNGASFNSILLSSTGLDLAVDNIVVAVPEPAMQPALGLLLLPGLLLARRSSQTAENTPRE